VAAAPDARGKVDLDGGKLSAALSEFARETGAELLFDQKLVSDLSAPPVRGRLSRREALARLLSGTGIGFRNVGGSFILFRAEARSNPSVPDELAVPEILVIGRRTQNADIRRTENDIQPYKVSTRRELESAHRSNVEEFTRARVPANAQASTRAQDVMNGDPGNVRSAIDLRGLGSRRTLVLVDGRRLPSPIGTGTEFDQGDLNGIPLSAIERIETLTGTAGGIHGPGALGGVVNVVLRRKFGGADLHVTSGISSRGDAKRLLIEGRLGLSPNDGRTAMMLLGSHQVSEPLLAGQRDFERRARELQFANNPSGSLGLLNASNSIAVISADGADLVLDPEFGGASLGASYTYLPLGFTGSRAEAVALLQQNAGELDFSLATDRSGALKSSVSTATVSSALMNLRHRPSDRIELFVEGLAYRNRGSFDRGTSSASSATNSNAPTNPFSRPVYFLYPLPGLRQERRVISDTARLSSGLIVDLPAGWNGSADYTIGLSRVKSVLQGPNAGSRYNNALRRGTPTGGLPAIDPLGDWERLVASSALYLDEFGIRSGARNNFREASVRLAGPLVRSEAGPVVLSLLAQQRVETVPPPSLSLTLGNNVFSAELPRRKQGVTSGYAELRAPLFPADAEVLPGLELQLAARYDRASIETFTFNGAEQETEQEIRSDRDGFNYTIGAKFYPLRRLMLRGSVATGEQYPTLGQLTPVRQRVTPSESLVQRTADPRRGGEPIGGGADVMFLSGGDPELRSERAVTIALGAVLNPSGGTGPRVSLDYSRIDRRREVVRFPLTPAVLLTREDEYPGRVARGPLTEADARLGFTAGPVTRVDVTRANEGRTIAEVVDLELDWRMPFSAGTEIQLYGSASWQPQLRTRRGRGQPFLERVGFFEGPSSWRGNIGVGWTQGPLSLDLNLQAFGAYRVTYADPSNVDGVVFDNGVIMRYQGRERVPSQAYVDFAARRRFQLKGGAGPLNPVQMRFGIQNVFDKRPPTIVSPYAVPYSTYGDARRRRFELALSAGF
jgi:outer membrane receptor protein involved in Fe transport